VLPRKSGFGSSLACHTNSRQQWSATKTRLTMECFH